MRRRMWGSESQFRDLSALAALTGDELRAAFRRVLADLAAQLAHRPLPLEGVDPALLLAFVQQALAEQLFDDLEWLSPASAASVLYELMCSLPHCPEREFLGQLVEQRLAYADAPTFVALATLLVQGSRTGLSTLSMRARVSLALSLPMGSMANVDGLALALISRPDFAREWVEKPSQGSLPSRRLAARLLERAAREAARRFAERDDAGLRALESAPVKSAWDRLLADRESLVWRHVAVARGLLVGAVPRLRDEVERSLDPTLSPTEWRRGATSLAASIAVVRERALQLADQLLKSDVLKRDPGVASCMIMGLLPAVELEPAAAERLLLPLVKVGGLLAAEACIDMFDEGAGAGFGREALRYVQGALIALRNDPETLADDGAIALIDWLLGRLAAPRVDGSVPLDQAVQRALVRFELEGTEAAVLGAASALSGAERVVQRLLGANPETREGRIDMARALIEVDLGLLQASTLFDLCALLERDGSRERLERLFEQLSDWFLKFEQTAVESAQVPHPALRVRRIRALLHMVDAEGSYGDEFAQSRRPRRLRITRALLNRVRREASSVLSRAVMACLARTFDALVREEAFELSDVVLCASLYVRNPDYIQTLAEASMVPELNRALTALSGLVRKCQAAQDLASARKESVEALAALTSALPAAHSPRVSALRWALTRMHVSLRMFQRVRSLQQVVAPELGGPSFVSLSDALLTLAQLIAGVRRRLNPSARVRPPSVQLCVSGLRVACEELLGGDSVDSLDGPLADLEEALAAELSPPFHASCLRVLESLKTLPLTGNILTPSMRGSLPGSAAQKLPGWLPPTRLLGGFYVLSALGEGAGGSVFMARRAEERDDESAEVLALKVPEYNGDVAHLLSEADFLRMFREEAGALLALPESPHIARFVTFDAGVRPKPILVMEHVEGPSLEKLLLRRHMDVEQAFTVLSGIAEGLAAMHQNGIAHLDLKPGNVIVRGFWHGNATPVLVDFGLSGRRLRPGCGTPNYAAPEIWGAHEQDGPSDPRAADVYALGCLAFELLTGEALFSAKSGDVAVVAAHVSHDGAPPPIQAMHRDLGLRALAEWISRCLRQKPSARASVAELMAQLPFLQADLAGRHWPLSVQAQAVRSLRVQGTK